MGKRGRVIYAPKSLVEFADQVCLENNMKKGNGLNKTVEYAKVGKEIERLLKKVGYL